MNKEEVKKDMKKQNISIKRQFLLEHFKYHTANSWNGLVSFAKNIKIYNVIPKQYQDRAYELLECSEAWDGGNYTIEDFEERHNYKYQIGTNGRSGGYLVLYQGGRKISDYKSVCVLCGQRNYKSVKDGNNVCGKCGEHARKDAVLYDVFTTMKGYSNDDILDMGDEDIKQLYDIVVDFDRTCKKIIDSFIHVCKNYIVVDEEYTVTKTRKVLQEVKS